MLLAAAEQLHLPHAVTPVLSCSQLLNLPWSLSPCSVEQGLWTFFSITTVYRRFRVYLNKTGGRRKLFITIVPVRQVESAGVQHFLGTFSSPHFGVKLVYNYRYCI